MSTPVFPLEEYEHRVDRVREEMDRRGLDALLVASPENIYYLTGLDHMGYFAYQALVLPRSGDLSLVARTMERVTLEDQVPHCRHVGYSDGIEPLPAGGPDDAVIATRDEEGRAAGLLPWEMSLGRVTVDEAGQPTKVSAQIRATCKALHQAGVGLHGKVGLEKSSTFLPHRIAEELVRHLPRVHWNDASGLVDGVRYVQSPLEQERTRQAAKVSDSMMLSAIAAAGPGVNTCDVMAAIYDTMFRRGGTYPGFVPLVRSTRTLEHEHGTWQSDGLQEGDLLFLEMGGCIRRYHAPLGRLVHIGEAPEQAQRMQEVCREALYAVRDTLGPGVKAGEVYRAWQERVDQGGLSGYRRHHCGYSVGIGYPPSWSGSGVPVGLRADSDLILQPGMVFHLMSWLLRTGQGDAFLSDTALVTDDGCDLLTNVSRDVIVR